MELQKTTLFTKGTMKCVQFYVPLLLIISRTAENYRIGNIMTTVRYMIVFCITYHNSKSVMFLKFTQIERVCMKHII